MATYKERYYKAQAQVEGLLSAQESLEKINAKWSKQCKAALAALRDLVAAAEPAEKYLRTGSKVLTAIEIEKFTQKYFARFPQKSMRQFHDELLSIGSVPIALLENGAAGTI